MRAHGLGSGVSSRTSPPLGACPQRRRASRALAIHVGLNCRPQRRFFRSLLKAGKASLLIFTGGQLPWLPNNPPEGDLLKPFAVQMGVPLDRIVVTSVVENTEDEAREVRRHLGPGKRVVLVTSAYHLTRATRLFMAQGLEVIPFPVDFNGDSTRPWTVLDVIPTP